MHDELGTPRWRRYLRFWGPNVDADVDDELQFHLDMRSRDLEALGIAPDDARRGAARRFGDAERIGAELRQHDHRRNRLTHRRDMLSDLCQDLRLAVRGLQRTPGFALVVVSTLALCIGANSAIFSVVNAVLLRPLPFRDPGALIRVYQTYEGERGGFSGPNFIDLTEQSRTLADAAAFDDETFNVVGTGDPVRVNGSLTSASFFDVLGVQPIVVRTDASAQALTSAAKRELSAIDPTLPMADVRSLASLVAESISQPRFYMVLLGVFAGIALMLAAIGVAGMMSFAVAQRTREIGIRIALGANRRGVVRLVLREAMRLAAVGVIVGGLVAAALSRAMASLLFGVGVRDPATFAIAAIVLAGVAFAATLLPARRAASVDPATALRADELASRRLACNVSLRVTGAAPGSSSSVFVRVAE